MNKTLPIFLIHTGSFKVIGGANFHTICLYKELLAKQVNVTLLVSHKSEMELAIQKEGLPFQAITH
jgi:hypothetical protein